MKTEMKSGHVLHQGRRIACRSAGAGGDSVVFVHADFVDSRMWDKVMPRLGSRHAVLAFDKLGYGSSDPAPGPMCRRKELAAVLEAAGPGPFHLVGCSNGGRQALDYALENPRRVASLTLVNSSPSGFQPAGEPPVEILEMLHALQDGRLNDANELQTHIWFDGPSRGPGSLDGERLAARAPAKAMNRIFLDNNTFAVADMVPVDPLNPPAIRRLSEIKVPTLVVSGGLDFAENRRASMILAEGIPGARHVEMKDCAHVPSMEEPDSFAALLQEHLSRRG